MVNVKPGNLPLPKKGEIRVAPVGGIPELLREFAIAPGPLLKTFGLTEEFFHNPDNPISFVQVGRLLKTCARETGCEHFGLLLGQLGNSWTFRTPVF